MGAKLIIKEDQILDLKRRMAEHKKKPGPLMPSLHDAQSIFGCVPLEVQKIIADELGESIAKINGVVTFYSRFTIEPVGKHTVSVCLGTACYVKGSQTVLDELSNVLGIKPGETTEDGLFTLSACRCIGACGLSPAMTIDGQVTAQATPAIARKALEALIAEEKGNK